MTEMADGNSNLEEEKFDFVAHRVDAVEAYRRARGGYEDLGRAVASIMERSISNAGLKVQSIDNRAKTEESFGSKAARPLKTDPSKPKYERPLEQIHDLAGVRVITFFLDDVQRVREIIEQEFDVVEALNRSSYLRGAGRPGYESLHFVLRISTTRLGLSEYSRFSGMVAEVQVRTILQHAWAEIEHDIQYKSVDALPAEIGQRFQALAGLIEIADREFQGISDTHEDLRKAASVSLEAGRLEEVELTAETLKAYLDRSLGPDGRMRDWVYDWTASYLRKMGFANLQQLHEAVDGLDDVELSRIIWGSRQGQIRRFELMLLAALGPERMKASHPWAQREENWFRDSIDREASMLLAAGQKVHGMTEPSEQG